MNKYYMMIEKRIEKLERAIASETFVLDKHTKAEEDNFVNNLFHHYQSLDGRPNKDKRSTGVLYVFDRDKVNNKEKNPDDLFNLQLNYRLKDGVKFIITAASKDKPSRNKMVCQAMDGTKNLGKIEFKLNEGINDVAKFILDTLKGIKEANKNEYKRKIRRSFI